MFTFSLQRIVHQAGICILLYPMRSRRRCEFSCQQLLRGIIIIKKAGAMRFVSKIFRAFAGLCLTAVTKPAFAQELSTNPQGSGVIVNAMRWMQGSLLGSVATVAAVIAIASVGFLMLTGRINWRHGAVVILGCFILFGAASIVAGIQSAATLSAGS
jgi:type IV secretion system protein VirB2